MDLSPYPSLLHKEQNQDIDAKKEKENIDAKKGVKMMKTELIISTSCAKSWSGYYMMVSSTLFSYYYCVVHFRYSFISQKCINLK